MAKIDILLPVKNGREFLAESIDSILAQTFTDWRLLVLDHGSTDGSREMAQQYQARDSRVEMHSFPEARGLSGLLNCGLDIADCEFVMRHDADDVCYPDRLEIVLAAFAAQPDVVVIGGQADIIDASGRHTGELSVSVGRDRVTVGSLFHNTLVHPTSMMRFDYVRQHGVRYGIDFLRVLPEAQRLEVPALAEDYFLFGQLAIQGKCNNVPQKLIKYRWHGNNVSATRFNDQMVVANDVSRFLARTFCTLHELPYFDPAPFCNHGGILFDVGGQGSFDAEYRRMASAVQHAVGNSAGVQRELAYRQAIATRNGLSLLWRFHRFRSEHAPETGEWNAVRAWLIRHFPGKPRMQVATLSA